jgi:hypothetical protein
MPKPLVVSIPHRLTRQEAKARIAGGMGQVRQQLAPFVSTIEDRWDEDRMAFRVVALGQNVSGRIDVMDETVEVEVELPWALRLLAETVQKRIGKQGRLMLEKPPGE